MIYIRTRKQKFTAPKIEFGFSVYEMILLLCMLGILASIAVPAIDDHTLEKNIEISKRDILFISKQIDSFRATHNRYPDALDEAGIHITDPWGHHYLYTNFASPRFVKNTERIDHKLAPINSDYDLYSTGVDGQSHAILLNNYSRDDIIRANNGEFIELASKY